MRVAKAELIRLLSDVGFHHRSAKDELKFIFLKHTVERADGASAGGILARTVKMLVYMYGIYLVHRNLTIDYLIILVYNYIDNNIIAEILLYFKCIDEK
jgi:hypothetical protein